VIKIFLRDLDKENEKLMRVCLDITVNLCKLDVEEKKLQNELEKEKVVEQGKKIDVKNFKKEASESKKGIIGINDKKLKVLSEGKLETKNVGSNFIEKFKNSVLKGLGTLERSSEVTSSFVPSAVGGGLQY
jgi:hypothetical protein